MLSRRAYCGQVSENSKDDGLQTHLLKDAQLDRACRRATTRKPLPASNDAVQHPGREIVRNQGAFRMSSCQAGNGKQINRHHGNDANHFVHLFCSRLDDDEEIVKILQRGLQNTSFLG